MAMQRQNLPISSLTPSPRRGILPKNYIADPYASSLYTSGNRLRDWEDYLVMSQLSGIAICYECRLQEEIIRTRSTLEEEMYIYCEEPDCCYYIGPFEYDYARADYYPQTLGRGVVPYGVGGLRGGGLQSTVSPLAIPRSSRSLMDPRGVTGSLLGNNGRYNGIGGLGTSGGLGAVGGLSSLGGLGGLGGLVGLGSLGGLGGLGGLGAYNLVGGGGRRRGGRI